MILLIDTSKYSLSSDEFVKPVERIVKQTGEKTITKNIKDIKNLKNINKIIICGTALKDNGFLNHDFNFLKDFHQPVLGICAGMQIIAKLFNNEIYNQTEIGMQQIKFINGKNIEAYELHNFAVKSKGFKIIAQSENCTQIIQKDNFTGIMFHPEVRNEWLIKDFVESH